MRREDVQAFHDTANPTRDAVYGITAQWNNRAISLSCHVMTDEQLAIGGWERSGTMRAIYSGLDGPQEHDEVYIQDPRYASISTRWHVRSLTPSTTHNSTGYVLEPIP